MQLDDDAIEALWSIYDATGIRPEHLIPVLFFESGFDPGATNGPHYGVGQTSRFKLAELGVTPGVFLAMSQGDQIRTAVGPYFAGVVKRFGPIRSATRAEQANFEPATLAHVRGLSQLLEFRGTRAYADNAAALDPLRRGAITLSDLALVMSHSAASAPARAAIARAYALRTDAGRPQDPVYGQDFVDPGWTLAGLLLAGAWASLR